MWVSIGLGHCSFSKHGKVNLGLVTDLGRLRKDLVSFSGASQTEGMKKE